MIYLRMGVPRGRMAWTPQLAQSLVVSRPRQTCWWSRVLKHTPGPPGHLVCGIVGSAFTTIILREFYEHKPEVRIERP
jgi:hypothetical protein